MRCRNVPGGNASRAESQPFRAAAVTRAVESRRQVKDPRVLAATAQSNMLGRLTEANLFLEDIQKGLNTYLEMKRLYFPR